MNKKSLVKIINQELTIIVDFVEGFDKNGNVHPKEIDIVLSKVRDIYDELLLLKDDNDMASLPDLSDTDKGKIDEENKTDNRIEQENIISNETVEPEIIEEQKEEEVIQELVNDTEEKPIEVEKVEAEINIVESTLLDDINRQNNESNQSISSNSEKGIEEVVEPIAYEKPEVEEKVDSEKSQKLSEKKVVSEKKKPNKKGKIIADKFSKDTPSINDMLTSVKRNKNLASLLKDSPIKDLKKTIKLNDKIWYISELFNKNTSTYEKTIDVVNSSEDLDKALEYLFANFTWDQNKKSTISFLELVFRRFANN